MKQIIWDELNGFEKFIFILGLLGALSIVFWIIMIIIYSYMKNKYKNFFNPETYKVVYVFGLIYFVFLAFAIFLLIIIMLRGINIYQLI